MGEIAAGHGFFSSQGLFCQVKFTAGKRLLRALRKPRPFLHLSKNSFLQSLLDRLQLVAALRRRLQRPADPDGVCQCTYTRSGNRRASLAGWEDFLNLFAEECAKECVLSAQPSDTYVWSHPVDLHYAFASVLGWPCMRVRVCKLGRKGKVTPSALNSQRAPRRLQSAGQVYRIIDAERDLCRRFSVLSVCAIARSCLCKPNSSRRRWLPRSGV